MNPQARDHQLGIHPPKGSYQVRLSKEPIQAVKELGLGQVPRSGKVPRRAAE
jgi:hypothetical protein